MVKARRPFLVARRALEVMLANLRTKTVGFACAKSRFHCRGELVTKFAVTPPVHNSENICGLFVEAKSENITVLARVFKTQHGPSDCRLGRIKFTMNEMSTFSIKA